MRILMVSDVYFPRVNGVSTSIQTFVRNLEHKGHRVTLIAPSYCDDPSYDNNDGLDIIRVPSRKVMFDPEDRMLKMNWVLARIDQLAKEEYDIIHIQTPFVAHYLGLKLSRALGIPMVETYHTYFEEYLYNYVPFVPKTWLRFLARRFSMSQCNAVDRVIVPSEPIEQALTGYGVNTQIDIIPTGLELHEFSGGSGSSFRKKHGIEKERPVVLYVGRMAHEKNIHFLLRSMQQVIEKNPRVLFVMAGEGPADKWARNWVKKNGVVDNVLFLGYLDRKTALLDCYCAADLFVFASRTETQGLVLLESMAMGTPVVSTAVLGTKSVLKEGQGVLIAQEDEQDFSAKVLMVLESKELRNELSKSASEYVNNWSSVVLTKKLVSLYHKICSASAEVETLSSCNTVDTENELGS